MKAKVTLLFLVILILVLVPSTTFADVIEPGKKQITQFYQISNVDDYPDYVFLIHGDPHPPYQVINSSEFTLGYKLSTGSIYAVRKSDFNEEQLKQMNDTQIDNYFVNDSEVLHSNIELKGIYKTVNLDDPLEKALIVLRIDSLDGKNLQIEKSKIIFTFNDGSTVETSITDQNKTPEPPKKAPSAGLNGFWYIILPVLAIIALAIILISRRYR